MRVELRGLVAVRAGTRAVALALLLLLPTLARAGPPFTTDDPEPVELGHWEVYVSSQLTFDEEGWSGTSPHFEVNYGAAPNLQLHLIAPLAASASKGEPAEVGYGDTELGAKFRFLQETSRRPQIAVFPLVVAPTGNERRGLGSGHVQALLPVWLEKGIGKWTTYGGVGYAINAGAGNTNWWLTGWLLQREVATHVTVGAEVFHSSAREIDGRSDTRFNVGSVVDVTEHHHVLFSAGRTIQGPFGAQAYVGYQLTF